MPVSTVVSDGPGPGFSQVSGDAITSVLGAGAEIGKARGKRASTRPTKVPVGLISTGLSQVDK